MRKKEITVLPKPKQILKSAWAFTLSGKVSECTQWVIKKLSVLHVISNNPDQTEWMPFIWALS